MRFGTIYTHSERDSVGVPQQGMCRKGKTVDVTWDLYPVVRNVRF